MATPMSSANTATTKIQRARRTRDFLLGVVDVFQRIVEQFLELLRLFGHVVTLRWCGCHDRARGFRFVPVSANERHKNQASGAVHSFHLYGHWRPKRRKDAVPRPAFFGAR